MRKRILIIAPDIEGFEPLPYLEHEINGISDEHTVTVLRGDISAVTISLAVKAQFDVLWFIWHAGQGDEQESTGMLTNSTIGAVPIAGFMDAAGADLCYLSSCDSKSLPVEIRALAGCTVLAGLKKQLTDERAASVGIQFAQALARVPIWMDKRAYRIAYNALHIRNDYLFLSPNGGLYDVPTNTLLLAIMLIVFLAVLYLSGGG